MRAVRKKALATLTRELQCSSSAALPRATTEYGWTTTPSPTSGIVTEPDESRQPLGDMLNGFLRVSDASNRLAGGMWGGLPRPEPVVKTKRNNNNVSVGFAPWREEAGQRLWAAVVNGELAVYVVTGPQVQSNDGNSIELSPEKFEPVAIPVNVLKRLITPRGVLPDRPIRPTIRTAEGNEKLFALLTGGLLVVRKSDFDIWYRSESAKGKWASQRSKLRVSNGRPTKQTQSLRNAVLALVRDHKWCGEHSIAALHRLLLDRNVSMTLKHLLS